jgi:hypothetical protein
MLYRKIVNNGEGIRNFQDLVDYYHDIKLGPLVRKRRDRKKFYRSDEYRDAITEAYKPERLKRIGYFNQLHFGSRKVSSEIKFRKEINFLKSF